MPKAKRKAAYRMPYGKYKNVPITAVPLEYLRWLATQDGHHEQLVAAVHADGARRRQSHLDVWRDFEDAVGLPRSTARSVHGVYLNAFEAGYFDRAVLAGRLVCEPCFPCATPIPEAWRRHCEAVGIECVIVGE